MISIQRQQINNTPRWPAGSDIMLLHSSLYMRVRSMLCIPLFTTHLGPYAWNQAKEDFGNNP